MATVPYAFWPGGYWARVAQDAASAPTGILSLPLDHLKTLIATCESFQTWCGVAAEDVGTANGITEAKEHIYVPALNEAVGTREDRPRVIVYTEPDVDGESEAAGASYFFHRGVAGAIFEDDAGVAGVADAVAIEDFTNNLGGVLEEMESLSGTGELLFMAEWHLAEGPARMHPDDVAGGELDLVQARINVRWQET